jgi:hypothetical protein
MIPTRPCAPTGEWIDRFADVVGELMPALREAAPDLSEDALLPLAARLAELRLASPLNVGLVLR